MLRTEKANKINDKTINASNIDLTGTLFTKKRQKHLDDVEQ